MSSNLNYNFQFIYVIAIFASHIINLNYQKMQYTTVKEFLDDWAFEGSSTQKVIDNLTDESLKQSVYSDGGTLGKLGWHLTETIGEMLGRTGLKVFSPDMTQYNAASAAQLKECYKHASESLVE